MKHYVTSAVTSVVWISLICAGVSYKTAQAGRMVFMKMCTSVPDPFYSDEDLDGCGSPDAEVVTVQFDVESSSTDFSSPILSTLLSVSANEFYDIGLTDETTDTAVSAHSIFVTTTNPGAMLPDLLSSNEFPSGAHGPTLPDPATSTFEVAGANLVCQSDCTLWVQFVDLTSDLISPSDELAITSLSLDTSSPSSTPEPATCSTVALAGLVLLALRRRQRRFRCNVGRL